MRLINHLSSLLIFILIISCANKDTAYDPDFKKGETLFDQKPNPDGEAMRVCAGHLPPKDRKLWQSGRC